MPDNPLKPEELLQVAAMARRYYLEGESKSDIADEFKVSRFRVARLLDRARASGLVRVEIVLPAHIDAELSARLRQAYALQHAIAVDTPDEPEEALRARLGEVAAGLLSEIVEDGDVLGIAWGRTIQALTGALTQLARCTVVQLTGVVGRFRIGEDSVEIVRRVAALAGGASYPIYAPMVVDSADTATALRRQSHVNEALKCFDRLTKAVVAIGSITPPNSGLYDGLDSDARETLRRRGARGETCGIPVDEGGCVVMPEILDRTITIAPDKLRRVPEVLAVAGGRSKAAAFRAVLAAGFVTSVVTDANTARALLVDPVAPLARKAPRVRRSTRRGS